MRDIDWGKRLTPHSITLNILIKNVYQVYGRLASATLHEAAIQGSASPTMLQQGKVSRFSAALVLHRVPAKPGHIEAHIRAIAVSSPNPSRCVCDDSTRFIGDLS